MIDRDVLFSRQRRAEIVADKALADQPVVGMRIADPAHVGHYREQQIVTHAHRLGQGLNDIQVRIERQGALHLRGVCQRARHRQRGIFHAVAGGVAYLHQPQGPGEEQYRPDHAANHQRDPGAKLHRRLLFGERKGRVAHGEPLIMHKVFIITQRTCFIKTLKRREFSDSRRKREPTRRQALRISL